MDPYTFHLAVTLWSDKSGLQEKVRVSAPPPAASAPAEPGKRSDAPLHFEPVKPEPEPAWLKHGYRPDWGKIMEPAPARAPESAPNKPAQAQVSTSSVARPVQLRPGRIRVVVPSVATVQAVVQPLVQPVAQPVMWSPYWYSAGGCSSGQCGRR